MNSLNRRRTQALLLTAVVLAASGMQKAWAIDIVWGSNHTRPMTAPTQDEATRLAMDDCRQHDAACEVFYEACSYPEQVQ